MAVQSSVRARMAAAPRRGFWFVWCLTWLLVAVVLVGSTMVTARRSGGQDWAAQAARLGVRDGVLVELRHGQVSATHTLGSATAQSRFLWGSVSKPVAAAVVLDLARRGRLNLDALLATVVPGAPPVPIRALLNHTGGLPFGSEVLDVTRPHTSASAVAAGLHPQGSAPGTYRYSSLGYLYLQAVVERVTGGRYVDALRALLPGTTVGASDDTCQGLVASTRLVGPWAWAVRTGYDGAGAGYGYTCGSASDLAAFALRHLAAPRLDAGASVGRAGESYAEGWRITQHADGRTTHWHTGTVPGYFSAIHLDPATGDGVVMLLNASGNLHEPALATLAKAAFERVTGRPVTPMPDDTLGVWLPTGLLAVGALLLGVAGLARWSQRWWWLAAVVLVGLVASLGPRLLMGVPPRYVLLWEPGLVLVAAVWGLAGVLGVLRSQPWRRRARTSTPDPAASRPSPGAGSADDVDPEPPSADSAQM